MIESLVCSCVLLVIFHKARGRGQNAKYERFIISCRKGVASQLLPISAIVFGNTTIAVVHPADTIVWRGLHEAIVWRRLHHKNCRKLLGKVREPGSAAAMDRIFTYSVTALAWTQTERQSIERWQINKQMINITIQLLVRVVKSKESVSKLLR